MSKEIKKGSFCEEFFGSAKNRLQNSVLFFEQLDLGAFVRLFYAKGFP